MKKFVFLLVTILATFFAPTVEAQQLLKGQDSLTMELKSFIKTIKKHGKKDGEEYYIFKFAENKEEYFSYEEDADLEYIIIFYSIITPHDDGVEYKENLKEIMFILPLKGAILEGNYLVDEKEPQPINVEALRKVFSALK